MELSIYQKTPLKHGGVLNGVKSPEYNVWTAMVQRCENSNNPRYSSYGGRGISICHEWRHDFSRFLSDMGKRPSSKHSIERKNNDLGYFKDNCHWALPHEQMTNRRNTRFVDTPKGLVPLATLAKLHNIPANTLRFRILKGWALKVALQTPVRTKRPHGKN